MKILRIRKGYTTNSSSSSEWMNPKDLEKFLMDGKSPSGSSSHTETAAQQNEARMQHNVGILSTLVGAVVSLFLIDRIVRLWLKKKKAAAQASFEEES